MKKLLLLSIIFLTGCQKYGRSNAPDVCEGIGLPGCEGGRSDNIIEFITNAIALIIQYVAVVAVIALMISGIMYIISSGEEEKVNRAKRWIIWSLVGVFMSVIAWWIVNSLNNIDILG